MRFTPLFWESLLQMAWVLASQQKALGSEMRTISSNANIKKL